MISLGQTYFWKFLETCDVAYLDSYMHSMGTLLSEVSEATYTLQPTSPEDREMFLRWTKGYLSGGQQMMQKFPRFLFGFKSLDDRRSWVAVIHFTRIPHIRGIYSNRSEKHLLPDALQPELSKRTVSSEMADVFMRNSNHTLSGTRVGIYVHQKIQHLAALRAIAEDSKYTPEGSDLKELLRSLSQLFAEGKQVPEPIELSTKRRAACEFLEKCDSHVAASLGEKRLQALLQTVGITSRQWLNAGRRGLVSRLWTG